MKRLLMVTFFWYASSVNLCFRCLLCTCGKILSRNNLHENQKWIKTVSQITQILSYGWMPILHTAEKLWEHYLLRSVPPFAYQMSVVLSWPPSTVCPVMLLCMLTFITVVTEHMIQHPIDLISEISSMEMYRLLLLFQSRSWWSTFLSDALCRYIAHVNLRITVFKRKMLICLVSGVKLQFCLPVAYIKQWEWK